MKPTNTLPPKGPFDRTSRPASRIFLFIVLAIWLIIWDTPASPGSASEEAWSYSLLPGSYLIDDCPPCARPTIPQPLQGKFHLRLMDENPLFSRYAVEDLSLTAGSIGGRLYKLAGGGTYTVGGELALIQSLELRVSIDDGVTNRLCLFSNTTPRVERRWPVIEATVIQTNGTFTQVYEIQLRAAPLRDIWFSSAHGMTPGIWQPPTNHLSGGDLLSSAGRVVKENADLLQRFGLKPNPSSLGLDALDVLPGGEIAFSIQADVFSESVGWLRQGDLLSNRGRIIKRNQELTAAFVQMPPAPDAGLDGVQVLDDGEIYFSIKQSFFSEALGRSIRPGDLLSDRGRVVRSNEQLVEKFRPLDPKRDFGLDAFYVWPSGEIWFSVEAGFQGQHFESYGHGDLLSDQGYVISRNLDLVGAFQPLEDLADFGLDALFILTDAAPPAPAPRFTRIRPSPGAGVRLEWEGKGRVWQLLRSSTLLGPWLPASPLTADTTFDDTPTTRNPSFYRLHQW